MRKWKRSLGKINNFPLSRKESCFSNLIKYMATNRLQQEISTPQPTRLDVWCVSRWHSSRFVTIYLSRAAAYSACHYSGDIEQELESSSRIPDSSIRGVAFLAYVHHCLLKSNSSPITPLESPLAASPPLTLLKCLLDQNVYGVQRTVNPHLTGSGLKRKVSMVMTPRTTPRKVRTCSGFKLSRSAESTWSMGMGIGDSVGWPQRQNPLIILEDPAHYHFVPRALTEKHEVLPTWSH